MDGAKIRRPKAIHFKEADLWDQVQQLRKELFKARTQNQALADDLQATQDHLEDVRGRNRWLEQDLKDAWDREERLSRRHVLVGVAEVAGYLGVSKQRVAELRNRHLQNGFPLPHATLACGQIWFYTDIMKWKETWVRKPGRPKKEDP